MIDMTSLSEKDCATFGSLLDHLSLIFADHPMIGERKEVYMFYLLLAPEASEVAQILAAVVKTIETWRGDHFPWPADIRAKIAYVSTTEERSPVHAGNHRSDAE